MRMSRQSTDSVQLVRNSWMGDNMQHGIAFQQRRRLSQKRTLLHKQWHLHLDLDPPDPSRLYSERLHLSIRLNFDPLLIIRGLLDSAII